MLDGLKVFIGGDASDLKKAIREADYAIKGFVNQNKQALKSVEKLGAPAAVAMTGLTLGIGVAVKKFGDFEATLNRVQAVSNASASEMAALKVKAEELGAATKFSGQEAASGMEELAKAGFNAKQTMDAIPGVLQLAAAGGVSVAQAAELAGGTIRGFGLAMDEAGRVADVMAQAANQSSVDIGDLQLTMKYVAPVASSASQSLEEMSGAIAIMGNSMIKGEQAGTTLRAALTRLQDPPKEAGEQLSALGIAISDTQGRMLPLGDIVDQLRTKTAKMTEVQRNAAIAQIFGTEALSGMLTLVKASPAEYQAMVDSMRNADGAAKKMSDTINSGFNGAMDQLGASVESAGLAIGENLAPVILALAGGIKGAVDAFNGMDPALKTLATGAIAGGIALTGMVAAAGLLLPVLGNVRAALFAMNTLALTPVGATIAALALTVGVATLAFKAHSDAVNAASKKENEAREARIKGTATVKAQKDELEKLAKEYHNLAGKSKLSKDEQERLKAIQDKLAKEYPGISEVIAKGATSHDKVEAAVRREIAAKADLLKMDQVAAQQRVMSDATQLANERRKLDELQQRFEDAKSAPSYGDSTGKVQELNVISGMIAAQQRAVDAVNARVLASAADLQRVNGIVIPKSSAAKPNRGNAYSGGEGKAKGGKSDAQKEAEDIAQAAKEIAEAYREAAAAKVEAMQRGNYMATAESEKFHRDEAAEIAAAVAEDAAFHRERVANMENANNLIERAGWELADEMDAATQQGIREMQGALTALAIDPSLERLANFAQGLAADKEKLAEWGETIKDVGAAFGGADGKAQDFGAALSKLGGAFDPVSLAVSGLVLLVNTLTQAWESAAQAQRDLADAQKDIGRRLLDQRIAAEKDPAKRAELTAQRDTADLQDEVNRFVEQVRPGLVNKAINDRINAAPVGLTTADVLRIMQEVEKEFTFEKVLEVAPEIKQLWEDGLEGIRAGAKETSEAIKEVLEPETGGIKEAFEGAADAAMNAAERLAGIKDEVERGGRDSWGNRISLEAETLLKIQEADHDLAEKKAASLKKQRDLYEEIAEINRDEREAIAGIENEGIAVRAKSEFQDKTERISKVKAEAQAKRDAKTEEINAIEAQMVKEQAARDKAVSNIRILGAERIEALRLEGEALEKVIDKANRLAAAYAKSKASGGTGGASSNASNNTTGAKYGDTSGARYDSTGRKVAYTKNGVNYYHTGGTVKSDETPAILRKNEFVLTPPMMSNLLAAASGGQGGFSMGDVHIHIQATPGMDGRAVGEEAWRHFAARARRAQFGR